MQETYLRAVKAFERFRPDSNVKSCLFTILRNVRLNQIRDRPSKSSLQMDGPDSRQWEIEDKSSKDPLNLHLTDVEQADVRKAIQRLPDVYREVIVLREFEELSYREIARILACPSGTVMSRLSRAREKLKQMLEHWNSVSGPSAGDAGE